MSVVKPVGRFTNYWNRKFP